MISTAALFKLEEHILSGGRIEKTEAREWLSAPDEYIMALAAAADRIRLRFKGRRFDACSLINARSGRCSEDCKFCAQSGHYSGECEEYDLRSSEDIVAAAKAAKENGARRFCTVTSGGALSDEEFEKLCDALAIVRSTVDIQLDASLGFLNDYRVNRLKSVGVTRYNHNLETAPEYYSEICSTHDFTDRVDTVRAALGGGFSACSGGIIGMGETPEQRLELAFALRELGVDCVPINVLNPRPGTPLEGSAPIPPMEIIRTVALFRLILPAATIKIAGGREKNLGDFQALALRAGANGMIIGGYLTTGGRSTEDDIKMVRDAGFEI